MNTRHASTKPSPLEIARHIVTQAHRERVRLRRMAHTRVVPGDSVLPVAREEGAQLRVVVGVDESDASRRALTWAAREAKAHSGHLTVCWTGPARSSATPTGPGPASSAHGDLDRIEDEILAVVAAAAPDLDPDVRLVPAVLEAKADELADLARDADLLVVARPYQRYLSRQAAASVTRRLVNHAGCPVLLVP